MKLSSYLFLDGRSEEALGFYASALGGRVEGHMRYADQPDIPPEYLPPGGPQSILHASILVGDQRLMLSDGACPGTDDGRHGAPRGFSLVAGCADEAQATRTWDALLDGGQVLMPIGPTFFSPCYGQLVDRFGVQWMVMAEAAGS